MDERQKELLKEIVESYIKEAKPIGSKQLCDKFNCSSATIRNEMAFLEKLGFIEKNHISSGRVPSELGYKYYVENLMKPKELTGEDMLKLQTIFSNQNLMVSDAIEACLEIISDITNYTSISLGKESYENTLKQISIIPLDEEKIVALVCTDKGIVRNKQFNLSASINVKEIVKTSEIINKMLIGTPISMISERLEYEIKPIISQQLEQYETIYGIFYEAFNDFVTKRENVHVVGKSKMLAQPEYNDTDEIKRLISKLEDNNQVRKIEKNDKDKNINVYIGKENEFDDNVTVINMSYSLRGEEGTIAIIGPKRMEYDRVVGVLNILNKWLEEKGD
ncbi:MAG: heat-inducible transcription repressor HrcA [Firmicutes bacterium]|nr:heat-inducible transcription repressor HrcA [Bacillota bacterium]